MSVRSLGLLLSLVLLSTVAYTTPVGDLHTDERREALTPEETALVSPDGTNSYVWPYTSRSQSVSGRTLALNVVVLGDSERVRRVLATGSDANWSATNRNTSVRISPWRRAHGSVRYTYVAPDQNASGRWIPADYQLHVGAYFGQRTHLRAYSSRSGNWTALQAHTEYWDWFRVRHTVTGVAAGARFVEHDLRDEPYVTRVTRAHHGHRGGGSDGWWTVIGLAPALVLIGSAARVTDHWPLEDIVLPGALLGVVLGVRGLGLAAEAVFPGVTPKLFVVIGYPILAGAPPALVSVLAADRPTKRVVSLTAAGFVTGIVLDMALIGVRHVPTRLAYHRVGLVAVLVVIAFGSARGHRCLTIVGIVVWLSLLITPLVGVL